MTLSDVSIDLYEESNQYNGQNVGALIGYAPLSLNFYDDVTEEGTKLDEGKGRTFAGAKWKGNTEVGKTKITIENVSIDGMIDVKAHVGGFIGKLYADSSATLKNCTNNLVIYSHDVGGMAGFIGFCKGKASFDSCVNAKGSSINYIGKNTDIFFGDYVSSNIEVEYTLTNCHSYISHNIEECNAKTIFNCFSEPLSLKELSATSFSNFGNVILSDCSFIIEGDENGYVKNSKNGTMQLINCSVESITNTGIMTINNKVDSQRASISNYGDLTITSGSFDTFINGKNGEENNAVAVIKGGSFTTIKNYKTITVKNAECGTFTNGKKDDSNTDVVAEISGGSFSGKLTNYGHMSICGGSFSGKLTDYGHMSICGGSYATGKNKKTTIEELMLSDYECKEIDGKYVVSKKTSN